MKHLAVLILAAIVVLALVAYASTYTVRFTETAVLTTFGKAEEGAVKTEPGLKFKVPYPVQNVTKYDKRVRILNTTSETQQTADNRQVIVESFCIWRVADPLKFFQRFSPAGERAEEHFKKAEDALRAALRSAVGATSRFRMDELFTADAAGTKLPELEKAIQTLVTNKEAGGASLVDYGVEVVDVGISRVRLPEDTTREVFNAMGAQRDQLASDLTAQGAAVAQSIRSRAESDAQRIRAFAERRAQEIRTVGDREAAEFLRQMNANPELAVFLKNMELLRDTISKRTTIVLPSSMPGVTLVAPDALNGLKAGQIPDMNLPEDWKTASTEGKAEPAGAGGPGTENRKQ